jgi:hypothetical protein
MKRAWGICTNSSLVFPPQLHPLFPQRVLADDQRADPLLHQELDDATAGRVQILQDTAVTLRRQAIELARGETLRFGKLLLQVRALFVVELIGRLQRAAIDQARDEPWFVGDERRKAR